MGFFTALKVVTGIVGTVSAVKSSKAQNKQAKVDMRSARQAGSFDLSILQNQIDQIIASSDNEVIDRQRQGAKDRAKILVSAGEANISGNSLMRMIASNMLDENRDKGIYKRNLENQIDQTALEARKVRTNANSNAEYASSKRTNPFLTGLAVGVPAGLDAYNTYKQEQIYRR